jgi:cell wall-associated NlpC family hydrolase
MSVQHQHADLIGTPFLYGARGDIALDCYGLVKQMYRREHGIELPDFLSPEDQGAQAAVGILQLQRWQQVPRQPGVMVAFRLGRLVSHCGYTLDNEIFIHAWQKAGGVSLQPLDHWSQRIAGYYRYVG